MYSLVIQSAEFVFSFGITKSALSTFCVPFGFSLFTLHTQSTMASLTALTNHFSKTSFIQSKFNSHTPIDSSSVPNSNKNPSFSRIRPPHTQGQTSYFRSNAAKTWGQLSQLYSGKWVYCYWIFKEQLRYLLRLLIATNIMITFLVIYFF